MLPNVSLLRKYSFLVRVLNERWPHLFFIFCMAFARWIKGCVCVCVVCVMINYGKKSPVWDPMSERTHLCVNNKRNSSFSSRNIIGCEHRRAGFNGINNVSARRRRRRNRGRGGNRNGIKAKNEKYNKIINKMNSRGGAVRPAFENDVDAIIFPDAPRCLSPNEPNANSVRHWSR